MSKATITIANVPLASLDDYLAISRRDGDTLTFDNESEGYRQIIRKRDAAMAASAANHFAAHPPGATKRMRPPQRIDPDYDPTNPEHVQRGRCNC